MRNPTSLLICLLLSCFAAVPLAVAADPAVPAGLSVAQIVERHVAARGGLQSWRAVQTLTLSGKIDAGTGDSVKRSIRLAQQGLGASARRAERAAAQSAVKAAVEQQVQLPFRLEMKRPGKSRLEIDFAGNTAVQVYDGQHGWKLRPYLNRDDVEAFTADEAKSEATRSDLEPQLVDYAAKGTQVALEGMEKVDGRDAYKLKLTLKSSDVQHVWIDAQSFLDVKIEGVARRMDGRMRSVWIYQREFKSVHGVMVPYLYETAIDNGPQTHRMVVDAVAVNRTLDDARFAKPQVLVAGSTASAAPDQLAAVKK